MRTAPTFTLKRSPTASPWPNVNCELPPPESNTTTRPPARSRPRPAIAARHARRAPPRGQRDPPPAGAVEPEALLRVEVVQPRLFLARDDLDADAGPRLDR